MRQVFHHLLALFTLVLSSSVLAADTGTIEKSIGKWQLKCTSVECQLSTFTPPGEPSTSIYLSGVKADVEAYAFFVRGEDISTKTVLGIEFARIVADKSKPGCAQATDSSKSPECFNLSAQQEDSFSGPVTLCQSGVCISKLVGDADSDRVFLPHFKNFDAILLVFRDDKSVLQTQALDIRGFSDAYGEAVKLLGQGH
jgi:hypothetical protein